MVNEDEDGGIHDLPHTILSDQGPLGWDGGEMGGAPPLLIGIMDLGSPSKRCPGSCHFLAPDAT